jgi:MATE family multidrug resistance protein
MSSLLSRRRTLRELLVFALPVMAGQLGLMLIGAGDMLIATQHSTTALAAIGIAVAFANPVFIVGLAFHMALSPLIARYRGEGRDTQHLAWNCLLYTGMLSLPFVAGTWGVSFLVPMLDYDPVITEMVVSYLRISAYSVPGAFLYSSLREWLQAHERTFLANATSLLAVAVNLYLNWALCFGRHIFPELGVDGLAWASLTVRYLMGFALLIPLLPLILRHRRLERNFLKEAFMLGAPTSVGIFLEVMAFCSVTLAVAKFGEIQTAANNLVLTLASCTFMIPMAIASAVGVKVGHAYGEKNAQQLRRFAWTGLLCSVGFMACSATVFTFLPETVLGLFGANSDVLEFGTKLIVWVALFQVFDGAQVTLASILRGVGIAKPVSVIIFVGYWIIGLPLGWWLAHHQNWQGQGFWIGLTISLMLVSGMLLALTWRRIHRIHA